MNESSLEKIRVRKMVGSVDSDLKTANKVIEKLSTLVKLAEKDGLTDIRIDPEFEPADDCNLENRYISVTAMRLETDEEWHRRLESNKDRLLHTIENGKSIVQKEQHYRDKCKEIDEALSKSNLKCKYCGKPTSISWNVNGKMVYTCPDCFNKNGLR